MNLCPRTYRGRRFLGGPFCFLFPTLVCIFLAVLWITPSFGEENEEQKAAKGIRIALDRIEALKRAPQPDLTALQNEYLILFENYPRAEEAKRGIFELYHLMRTHQRIHEAYAALTKIMDVYHDNETMNNPYAPDQPILLVATAQVELAFLFATGMDNPYTGIEKLKLALTRFPEKIVGTSAPDRDYVGPIEAIAHWQLADYYLAANQPDQAGAELLSLVRDQAGKVIYQHGTRLAAATAGILKLSEVMKKMPATEQKRLRLLQTFEQTAVEREARIWLKFLQAEIQTAAYQEWKNPGALDQGLAALQEVIVKHREVLLAGPEGEEPAGIRAMRIKRDITANILGNVDRAGSELSVNYVEFAKDKKTRLFAGYALLYLAELELDFRRNAVSAFKMFGQVADQYGDLELFPRLPKAPPRTLQERAKSWAKRAQERM